MLKLIFTTLLLIAGLVVPLIRTDVIKNPDPNPNESEMKLLEVEFDEGTGCDNTGIEIEITTNDFKRKQDLNLATRDVKICKFDVKKNEKQGNRYLVGHKRLNKCFNDKRDKMFINNLRFLPFFKMRSKENHNFCLKSVTLTTDGNKTYLRTFTSYTLYKDTKRWMPMFESTYLEYQRQELDKLKCPEDEDVQSPSCPKDNIAYKRIIPENKEYCAFNPNCNSVSSSNKNDTNSGYICYETNRGKYDNYELCCNLGEGHGLQAC